MSLRDWVDRYPGDPEAMVDALLTDLGPDARAGHHKGREAMSDEPDRGDARDHNQAARYGSNKMSELDEWKQAASVEAGLRREFLARAEKAEADNERLRATNAELVAACREVVAWWDEEPHRTGGPDFAVMCRAALAKADRACDLAPMKTWSAGLTTKPPDGAQT